MALIELKMKVYKPKYNYQHLSTMLSETQKEQYLKEQEQIAYEETHEFETWLEDHYTTIEIYNMSEEKRHEIDKEWRRISREYVEDCFEDEYDEEEITLRVDEKELNSHESFRLIGI